MVGAGGTCPWLRQQRVENSSLACMIDAAVRELDEKRIGRLQSRTGQCQEQARCARHTAKQPAATDVRIQPDGDLRHRHP